MLYCWEQDAALEALPSTKQAKGRDNSRYSKLKGSTMATFEGVGLAADACDDDRYDRQVKTSEESSSVGGARYPSLLAGVVASFATMMSFPASVSTFSFELILLLRAATPHPR